MASEIEIEIGFLAGEIFDLAIDEEKSLTQLKHLLNQDEKRLLMAIGWLARENKVLCRFELDDLLIKAIE